MRKIIIVFAVMAYLYSSVALAALTDNGDGTITDSVTGLMWQKDTAPGTYSWQNAIAYCENLMLAGHMDWRLPDINELQSLADYSLNQVLNIDPILISSTVAYPYWSSTTYASDTGYAWHVGFGNHGYVRGTNKTANWCVRAVRSGQFGSFGNLLISKSGDGVGTVSSTPAGINCGSQCTAYFNSNTPTTLTAQADANSVFMGWSGCDSVAGENCIVTFQGDKTVKAFFESNASYNKLDWINITDNYSNDIQLKVSSLYLYTDLNRRLDLSWANYPGNDRQFLSAIYSRDTSNSLRSKDRVLEYTYLAQSAKNFVAFDLKDTLPNAIKPNHIVYDREEPWFRTAYDAWTPSYVGEVWKEAHIFGLLNFGVGLDSDAQRYFYYKKIIEYAVLQPYITEGPAWKSPTKGKLNRLYALLAKNPAVAQFAALLGTTNLLDAEQLDAYSKALMVIKDSPSYNAPIYTYIGKLSGAIGGAIAAVGSGLKISGEALEWLTLQALVSAEAKERMNTLYYWSLFGKTDNIDPILAEAITDYAQDFEQRMNGSWWPLLEQVLISGTNEFTKETIKLGIKTAAAAIFGGPAAWAVWAAALEIDYALDTAIDPARYATLAATLQQAINKSGKWKTYADRFSSQTIYESDVRDMVNLVNMNYYLAWLHYDYTHKILTNFFISTYGNINGFFLWDFSIYDQLVQEVVDQKNKTRRIWEMVSGPSFLASVNDPFLSTFDNNAIIGFERLVTDNEGQLSGITLKDVNANFTTNVNSGTAKTTVFQFIDNTALLNGSIISCSWDFGDFTSPVQGSAVSHVYENAGYYIVTLTVSNGTQTDTKATGVLVHSPQPSASFTADITSGFNPLTISFTNQSTDAVNYEWSFGDGFTSISADTVLQHTYSNPGIYTVSLRASGGGGEDTLSKTNYIQVQGITGIIVINTNMTNAYYILKGPKTISGSGLSKTFTDMPFGNYEINCYELNGYYLPLRQNINLASAGPVTITVNYEPIIKADLNKDHIIDLKDAIIALQVGTGTSPTIRIQDGMDINGDNKIGLAEAIYILQKVAVLRP